MSTYQNMNMNTNQISNNSNRIGISCGSEDKDINTDKMNEQFASNDTYHTSPSPKIKTSPILQVIPNQGLPMHLQLPPPNSPSMQMMPLINTNMPAQMLQQSPQQNQQQNLRFHSPNLRGG